MADSNHTAYAPGVIVETWDWGRMFFGEREPLIDAGIAKPDWFPGEPGQRKTVGRGWRGNEPVTIYRSGKKRFRIWMHFNDEEKALAAEEKRQEKERHEKDGPKLSNVVPLKAVPEVGDRDTNNLLCKLQRSSVSYYSENGEFHASELSGIAVVAFYRDRKVSHFATGPSCRRSGPHHGASERLVKAAV